jgi:hypothetical protein
VLGLVPGEGVEACHDCATAGRGFATREGAPDDGFAQGFAWFALRALVDVREVLYPPGDEQADWSPDTIEEVDHALAFLRPPARP